MNARVFYTATLSFVLAIALGTVINVTRPYFLLLILLGVALCAVSYLHRSLPSHTLLLVLAVGLLAFGGGLWRVQSIVEQYATSPLWAKVGQQVLLEGTVVREPDVRERTSQLYVRVKGTTDLILVSVDRYTDVTYGDVIEIAGRLEVPEEFDTDLGRTFLYPEYLKARGVQFKIAFAKIAILERGSGNVVISNLLAFKKTFVEKLGTILSEPQSGLGVGLLLGVKQALGEELETVFRKAGIIHIVVLSGYNVTLVVAFMLFVLGRILPFTIRLVVGIGVVILFALMVGLAPTVVRASSMASLVLLAPLLGRQYHIMRALIFAGCAMNFLNPFLLLYDVGFQLSFLATLGLLLVAPQFEMIFMRVSNIFQVKEFFIATLATQVAVAPLVLYQIGELSLIAVVVNVLVLPLVGVAMLLTFVTGMVAFVSTPVAMILAVPTHFSLWYIIACARFFAGLPYASVVAPPFSVWLMVLAYGVMGVVWYVSTQKSKLLATMGENIGTVKKLNPSEIDTWTVIPEELAADKAAMQLGKQKFENSSAGGASMSTKKADTIKNDTDVPIFFR